MDEAMKKALKAERQRFIMDMLRVLKEAVDNDKPLVVTLAIGGEPDTVMGYYEPNTPEKLKKLMLFSAQAMNSNVETSEQMAKFINQKEIKTSEEIKKDKTGGFVGLEKKDDGSIQIKFSK